MDLGEPEVGGVGGGDELVPEQPQADEGENLLPGAGADSDADTEPGESLLPGGDDGDGESLLPGGDEGGGESLLPDMEDGGAGGESLLPDTDDSDLFPPGAADTVPTPDDPAATATPDPLADAGETAAAAHTTYLKWLQEEKRFPTAVTCAKCHPDHFAEWSVSAHAYA